MSESILSKLTGLPETEISTKDTTSNANFSTLETLTGLKSQEMDFSGETPEEKKIRLGGVVNVAGKVIPALAPFVPALQPVAAVIGALKK
jgi:hypothetical protein